MAPVQLQIRVGFRLHRTDFHFLCLSVILRPLSIPSVKSFNNNNNRTFFVFRFLYTGNFKSVPVAPASPPQPCCGTDSMNRFRLFARISMTLGKIKTMFCLNENNKTPSTLSTARGISRVNSQLALINPSSPPLIVVYGHCLVTLPTQLMKH